MIKKILKSKPLTIISVLVLLVLIYFGYKTFFGSTSTTTYKTSTVERGTIVVSITGSGQVSSSNQVDLKPKASGDVVYANANDGQEVGAGDLIVQLDDRDAQKAVRDAQINLESAKISLQKLQEPADTLSITQAENSLSQAKGDLQKAYDDGFNTVSNTFIDLPTIMAGLHDTLYGMTVNRNQDNLSAYADMVNYDSVVWGYKDDVAKKYQLAQSSYDQVFSDYKAVSRFSDLQAIEQIINETYNVTKNIAEAIKSANDLLNFVKNQLTTRQVIIPSILATHQGALSTYTSQTNSHLLDLSTIKTSIINSNQSITEKTQALDKLKNGADALDIQSAQLSIQQRQNALLDAQTNLDNYYVRAPFSGTLADVNIKKFDSVSSGMVVASLITHQKLAEISLNEVDVAKVKVGQKATVTFDAIDGLSIAGKVAEINTIGTVSQGVVTYGVKVGFDTQDVRVKSGMSVSAAIITDTKQDVLLVPNAAIKSGVGGGSYVEVLVNGILQNKNVEVGLSNDTMTEIMVGLNEGDQVVTQTISATTANASSAQNRNQQGNTGIRIPGISGGGGLGR